MIYIENIFVIIKLFVYIYDVRRLWTGRKRFFCLAVLIGLQPELRQPPRDGSELGWAGSVVCDHDIKLSPGKNQPTDNVYNYNDLKGEAVKVKPIKLSSWCGCREGRGVVGECMKEVDIFGTGGEFKYESDLEFAKPQFYNVSNLIKLRSP